MLQKTCLDTQTKTVLLENLDGQDLLTGSNKSIILDYVFEILTIFVKIEYIRIEIPLRLTCRAAPHLLF